MKLKDLEIFVVGTPPPGWGGRYWIFVKLKLNVELLVLVKSMLDHFILRLSLKQLWTYLNDT